MTDTLTSGQKAAQTRARNKTAKMQEQLAERQQRLSEEVVKFAERLKAGAVATYVNLANGYKVSDGLCSVSGRVVKAALRAEVAIKSGGVVRHSTPAEYAANRAKDDDERNTNKQLWLLYWRLKLCMASDDSDIDAVIEELVSWAGAVGFSEPYKGD